MNKYFEINAPSLVLQMLVIRVHIITSVAKFKRPRVLGDHKN